MRKFILVLLLLLLSVSSLAQDDECSALIQEAMAQAREYCLTIGRGDACYGHFQIQASAYDGNLAFSNPGDVEGVHRISSLRLSALDEVSGIWGIAMMRLETTTPITNEIADVSLIMFGDSEIENQVETSASLEATVIDGNYVNVRRAANPNAGVLAVLQPGQMVTATARTENNEWLRVNIPDSDRIGWVYAPLMTLEQDIESLSLAEAWTPQYGAMQAFYLSTGEGACSGAPVNGLLIQTPSGVAEVTLLVNEVNINMVGTAYATADDDELTIEVVDGQAEVESSGVTKLVLPGARVSVSLDENRQAMGHPNNLEPGILGVDGLSTVALLETEVAVPAPMTEAQIEVLEDQQPVADSNDSVGQDDGRDGIGSEDDGSGDEVDNCPGNSCNAPGQGGGGGDVPGQGGSDEVDNCPGNSCNAPGREDKGCPGNSCNAPGRSNN